jgi:hypothetical protein
VLPGVLLLLLLLLLPPVERYLNRWQHLEQCPC